MSNKNWTPGPWKMVNIDLENRKIHQLVGPFTVKNEVSVYDCYLAAAAPDLYDALEAMSAWCVENLTYEQFEKAKQLGFDAESAMAKARGEV